MFNKKNNAFTLIEIMLAMGILTLAVTIISDLQISSLFKLIQDRDNLERTFLIKQENYKKFWQENLVAKSKKATIEIESMETSIKSELVDIAPKSELKDFQKTIKIIQTEASWKSSLGKQTSKMISLTFIPPKPEDNKNETKKESR